MPNEEQNVADLVKEVGKEIGRIVGALHVNRTIYLSDAAVEIQVQLNRLITALEKLERERDDNNNALEKASVAFVELHAERDTLLAENQQLKAQLIEQKERWEQTLRQTMYRMEDVVKYVAQFAKKQIDSSNTKKE